jgi:hypothetical protein
MNPRQMPTSGDYVMPTLEKAASRVKHARSRRDMLAISNLPSDEIERMRLSIALQEADWELESAEACLREMVKAEDRRK